jgi:hypothetical protein
MKVNSGKAIVILLLVCSYFSPAHAQLNVPKHEIGFGVGMFVYQGDVTPEKMGAFKTPGFAINLFYNRILSRSFSLRTNLAHGRLMADDGNYDNPVWRAQRNFRFSTRTTEISELLVWNILGNNYGDRQILSPYIFGGVGMSSLSISRDWSRINYDYFNNDPKITEGLPLDTLHALPNTIPVIPIGAGVRYSISDKVSIMAEGSYRITFSDYIDGFSQAANPKLNDHYMNFSVGLIYTFGKTNSLDCPTMKY